ncbi:MAG: hypothetical protein WDO56_11900 [Gammaproteobacteria bacterium]
MKQTLALTFVNLRGTLQRPGTALVLIFAVAVSVAVLVCVLGLRQGLGAIVDNVGRSDRVLILGENAPSETASNLTRETLGLLQGAPGVALDAAGAPLMIAEAVIAVPVIDRSGAFADVALRGTSAQVLAVRPEARIVRGRLFQSGLREVVVGKLASEQYRDMDVGATLWLRNEPWDGGRHLLDARGAAGVGDLDRFRHGAKRVPQRGGTVCDGDPRLAAGNVRARILYQGASSSASRRLDRDRPIS